MNISSDHAEQEHPFCVHVTAHSRDSVNTDDQPLQSEQMNS